MIDGKEMIVWDAANMVFEAEVASPTWLWVDLGAAKYDPKSENLYAIFQCVLFISQKANVLLIPSSFR